MRVLTAKSFERYPVCHVTFNAIPASLLVIRCVLDRVKHRGVRDKTERTEDKELKHKQEVVDKRIFSTTVGRRCRLCQYLVQVLVGWVDGWGDGCVNGWMDHHLVHLYARKTLCFLLQDHSRACAAVSVV